MIAMNRSWVFVPNGETDEDGEPVGRYEYKDLGPILVPVTRLAELEERFEKLAKRARKLGVAAPTYRIGAQHEVEKERVELRLGEDGEPRPTRVKYVVLAHEVDVEGEAPVVAGWTFAARLRHEPGGTMVDRVLADDVACDLSRFYRSAAWCDHCGKDRRRVDSFVLRNDTGELKQVGRNCLRDFLGHESPEQLVAIAALVADMRAAFSGLDDDEEPGPGGHREESRFPLARFLPWAASLVQKLGYVSAKIAEEQGLQKTGDAAIQLMIAPKADLKPSEKKLIPDAEADALAAKVIGWLATLAAREDAGESLGDYLHNLAVVGRSGLVAWRSVNVAASAIASYRREVEHQLAAKAQRERAAAAPTQHVGTVGKREVFAGLTLERVIETSGFYGTTYIHKLRDAAGNLLVWFGSSRLRREDQPDQPLVNEGEQVAIKATVKKHDSWTPRGGEPIPQTVVSRAVVEVPKPPKTKRARKGAAPAAEAEKPEAALAE